VALEERIQARIGQLIDESASLSIADQHGQSLSDEKRGRCSAWLTSAQNVIYLVCQSPEAPYRKRADTILTREWGYVVHQAVSELASVLRNLLIDASAGLLATVADQARAETFDNFLDHASAYVRGGRKNEAGVIAGVVFEDTVRQICRKESIPEKDVNLDQLISALTTQGRLSGVKAKRARAAAHVRTKASHAQWDEFEMPDVESTIVLTHELIASHLDA
jgi:hypothetical protein